MIEITSALVFLHEKTHPNEKGENREVLHRDLKSLNILLTGGSPKTAVLGDFGYAKVRATKNTNPIGTFQWMAPEVCANGAEKHQ